MVVLPEAIPDLFFQLKFHMYNTRVVATVASLRLLHLVYVFYGATALWLHWGCSFPHVAPAWRCRVSRGTCRSCQALMESKVGKARPLT